MTREDVVIGGIYKVATLLTGSLNWTTACEKRVQAALLIAFPTWKDLNGSYVEVVAYTAVRAVVVARSTRYNLQFDLMIDYMGPVAPLVALALQGDK